jgi:hypothetical protein
MTKKKRWAFGAALAAALAALWAGPAAALSTDSLTVTVTPNAAYSLTLSTGLAANSFSLGNVNLAASTFTVNPATVTITSSFATTGLTLQGLLTGGWSLETADTSSLGQDKLAAWAVFTDTGVSLASTVAGLGGAFSGTASNAADSDVLDPTGRSVGNAATAPLRDYVLTAGANDSKTMHDLPPSSTDAGGAASHLWLKLTLPPTTSTLAQQSLTVVVTAGAPVP